MTITPDALAAALLRCPIGCVFLLTVERDGIPAALAVAPQQAFTRAAEELRTLNPWIPSFNEATAAVLARAPQLERLAHDLAEQPGADWWAAPVDRERQVLLVDPKPASRTTPASGWSWEDYAERPIDWRMTSTLRGRVSCGDVVIASGVGDWSDEPEVRSMAIVDAAARVREIVTPADWHALCASHPRVRAKPEPSPPPRSGWHYAPLGLPQKGPDRAGMLVPDWSALAADLDGVHLTFAGLLTVPFVEHSSDAGNTMMWSWDTEGTMWLQGAFLRAGEPNPRAPHADLHLRRKPWVVEERNEAPIPTTQRATCHVASVRLGSLRVRKCNYESTFRCQWYAGDGHLVWDSEEVPSDALLPYGSPHSYRR